MNTGIQRSSATPFGAKTTTTPIIGKAQVNKNMFKIMRAHGLSYIATCATGYPQDLYDKFKKAREFNGKGVRFIEILSSCPPGWGHKVNESVEVTKKAVECGYWPLMEVIEGKLVISNPCKRYIDKSKRKDVRDYLKMQSRFNHFTEDDYKVWEQYIDDLWKELGWELERQGDL